MWKLFQRTQKPAQIVELEARLKTSKPYDLRPLEQRDLKIIQREKHTSSTFVRNSLMLERSDIKKMSKVHVNLPLNPRPLTVEEQVLAKDPRLDFFGNFLERLPSQVLPRVQVSSKTNYFGPSSSKMFIMERSPAACIAENLTHIYPEIQEPWVQQGFELRMHLGGAKADSARRAIEGLQILHLAVDPIITLINEIRAKSKATKSQSESAVA